MLALSFQSVLVSSTLWLPLVPVTMAVVFVVRLTCMNMRLRRRLNSPFPRERYYVHKHPRKIHSLGIDGSMTFKRWGPWGWSAIIKSVWKDAISGGTMYSYSRKRPSSLLLHRNSNLDCICVVQRCHPSSDFVHFDLNGLPMPRPPFRVSQTVIIYPDRNLYSLFA